MKLLLFIFSALFLQLNAQERNITTMMKELTPLEKRVIENKGTEAPFTGEYTDFFGKGTYVCRKCSAELYRSEDKFHSGCGWPAFDDEIKGAVKHTTDADGHRIEITCAKCGGHLGHVFKGEGFTEKDTRHCVNSVSMKFIPDTDKVNDKGEETAIFAGGCFWGVEHLMQQQNGVKSVESGYIGGHIENPSYEAVCSRSTGHAEAVRITFDPKAVSYEELAKLFFEIHDPTQIDRQGPDIGSQYRSEVFYTTAQQKDIAEKLIGQLESKGYDIATKVTPASAFWVAEKYHQDYYDRKGTQPYCHARVKRF